jgi:hypothetical protein
MRYTHETFTKMILKNGFISFLFNNIGALYLSNRTGWNYRLPCTGRETPEPCSCTRPCTSKSLNSVNSTRINNTLQKSAMSLCHIFHALCFIQPWCYKRKRLVLSFMFHTLCMYRRQAMERTVETLSFFFSLLIVIKGGKSALC